jgi:WD40 repeat protein
VHPTLPYVLTSSDDMLIKLWDWDKGWACCQVFEGHSHYVMQVRQLELSWLCMDRCLACIADYMDNAARLLRETVTTCRCGGLGRCGSSLRLLLWCKGGMF